MSELPWFKLNAESSVDSPALVIYKDRVMENIDRLIASIDDPLRLRPHIKTHKSPDVVRMFLLNGISKFKCATIAEAEMLAATGATDILLAYQPVGPKAKRFLELVSRYPETKLSCLIDNEKTAEEISLLFTNAGVELDFFIDINVGMNRTGIMPNDVSKLLLTIEPFDGLNFRGLHAYDGHIRDADFAVRSWKCNEAFAPVEALRTELEREFGGKITIVAGGTPTYSVHLQRKDVECSPGTFIYWDKGYESMLREQDYLHAAVVITRVISRPTKDTICIDLGHKSIASENPLENRVVFLNGPEMKPVGHSEEHMTLKVRGPLPEVGDVLYGVPFHVCPTIALYDTALVATDHTIRETWITLSRNRKITI